MKENINMERRMGLENLFGQMDPYMRETFCKIIWKEKEPIYGVIRGNLKEL